MLRLKASKLAESMNVNAEQVLTSKNNYSDKDEDKIDDMSFEEITKLENKLIREAVVLEESAARRLTRANRIRQNVEGALDSDTKNKANSQAKVKVTQSKSSERQRQVTTSSSASIESTTNKVEVQDLERPYEQSQIMSEDEQEEKQVEAGSINRPQANFSDFDATKQSSRTSYANSNYINSLERPQLDLGKTDMVRNQTSRSSAFYQPPTSTFGQTSLRENDSYFNKETRNIADIDNDQGDSTTFDNN